MQDLSVHSEYIYFLKFQDCFKDRANSFVNLLQVYLLTLSIVILKLLECTFNLRVVPRGAQDF